MRESLRKARPAAVRMRGFHETVTAAASVSRPFSRARVAARTVRVSSFPDRVGTAGPEVASPGSIFSPKRSLSSSIGSDLAPGFSRSDRLPGDLVEKVELFPVIGHEGIRRDALAEENVRPYGGALADDRLAAEDGGVGIDHDVVPHVGMPFVALDDAAVLVLWEVAGAEGDPVVELDVIPDDGGLSDDHPGPVIDEKV